MKISKLFIGFNDGKKEATHQPNFEQYYFNYNKIYDKILQDDKFLLLGRKGTGKTILGEYINKKAQFDSNWFCKIASYKEFRFHELQTLKTEDIKPNEYIAIWEWIILIQIALECIKDEKISLENRNIIEKFLKNNFFKLDLNMNKIIEITKKNKITGSIGKLIGLSGGAEKDIKYKIGSYIDYLDSLRDIIIESLSMSDSKYTIIFDELDDQFRNEDIYKSNIISLIKVTERINSLFYKKNVKCKIILLLRLDIFYVLNDPDLNKIEEDSSVKIDWGKNDDKNSPLFDMIILKLRQSMDPKIEKKLSNQDILEQLFPESLHTSKGRCISSPKYILGRTYLRPRDVVTYLNHIKDISPDKEYFSKEAIKSAERKYSSYLFKEIKNELCGHLSNEEIDESFKLLKQFKKVSFYYAEIEEYYMKRTNLFPHINLHRMLELFFNFGVLGNQWTVKKKWKISFILFFFTQRKC